MANKAKKVKVNSSAATEQNDEDLRAIIAQLRAELESERKTNRQLRRENAFEVQQLREQEQTKASIGLKDLAARLQQEKQREVELQKEALRCRLEADCGKVVKLKDQEIKKLKQDLARCQEELKEEVTKRGLSTSARGTFETERNRLLQDAKDLATSRKQLEVALAAANDVVKQKNLEIRQLQDSSKLELARVEREANVEVKKLLEELKSKDNLLAAMDRSIYPDKANMLKHQVENLSMQELLSLSSEVEKLAKNPDSNKTADACVVSGGAALQSIAAQKRLYELEKQVKFANGLHQKLIIKNKALSEANVQLEGKVKALNAQLNDLNNELLTNKAEIGRLNEALVGMKDGCMSDTCSVTSSQSELDACRQQYAELQPILASLRLDCQEKDRRISLLIKSQEKRSHKYQKKSVRFLLPDDDESMVIEDNGSDAADLFESNKDPENDNADEVWIQSLQRDYERLMQEHLRVEKQCSVLLQAQPDVRQLEQENWMLEKESLEMAMWTLEEKLRKAEENEAIVRSQLEEAHDQNEELEFRILELEECTERSMSTFIGKEEVELMERNRLLEAQVLLLKKKLSQYENIDVEEVEKDVLPTDAVNESSRELSVVGMGDQQQRLSVENLRKLTATLSDSDEENPMIQSFSTMTSGFDEISCISLELDDKIDAVDSAEVEDKTAVIGFEQANNATDLPVDASEVESCNFKSVVSNVDEIVSTDITPENIDIHSIDNCVASTLTLIGAPEQEALLDTDVQAITPDLFATSEDQSIQLRIKDLQDQVDILQQNDVTFSDTIRALDQIEQKLRASVEHDSHKESRCLNYESETPEEIVAQVYTPEQQHLREDIDDLKESLSKFLSSENLVSSEFETESRDILKKSMRKLEQCEAVMKSEIQEEVELDEKIQLLEASQTIEFHEATFEARFNSIIESGSQLSTKGCQCFTNLFLSNAVEVKSLKLCAIDAIIIGFRKDFEEIKALAERFLSITDVDGSTLQPSAPSFQLQGGNDQLRSRDALKPDLRLNTDLVCTQPTFGFLSPTTFSGDWTGGNHLEVMNYCLHLQLHDLEKERDNLKEVACKNECIMSEQRVRISKLESSENHLQRTVKSLELAEQQAQSKISYMEKCYAELKLAIKNMESKEALMKLQLETCENNEFQLKMKLQTAIDLQQSAERKLKAKILDLEKDKSDLESNAAELSTTFENLQTKETNLKQRIKNLESSESSLQDKLHELESSLNGAYDELIRVNKQKDALAQRVNLLEGEKSDMQHELEESKEECSRLAADNHRLGEEESFLKEANRKMWLSLQASLNSLDATRQQANQTWLPLRSSSPPSHSSDELQSSAAPLDADAESADEASEIHDEDDGALPALRLAGAVTSSSRCDVAMTSVPVNRRGSGRKRAQSAGVMRLGGAEQGRRLSSRMDQRGMTVGLSVESVADSGLESLCEIAEKTKRPIKEGVHQLAVESTIHVSHDVTTALLQLELEEKDRLLRAKSEELARLTEELRGWQEKASMASEETSRLAAASAAWQEFDSGKDASDGSCQNLTRLQQKKKKKSRLEPYVSQIPVSVRRCRMRNSVADLRRSPIPNGSMTSQTHLESVHTAGSSLSQKTNYSLNSHIPRPIGDKGQVSLAKAQDEPEDRDEAPSGHPALEDVRVTSSAAAAGVECFAAQAAVAEAFITKAPFIEGEMRDAL